MGTLNVNSIQTAGGTSPVLVSDIAKKSDLSASSGASLVGYLPAGSGAVATDVQAKLREHLSVLDFMSAAEVAAVQSGAYGGITSVHAAIQAAVNAATAAQILFDTTGMAGRPKATLPYVLFPKGTYKLTASVNCDRFTNLVSDDKAYFEVSAGVTAFSFADCYRNTVSGLSFNAGATSLYFANANIDATQIYVDNCDFQLTTDYAIKTAGAPQVSGFLIVQPNCRFYNCAKVLYNAFDETSFGGWVEIDQTVGTDNPMAANSALFYNFLGELRLSHMMGIPNVGTVGRKANLRWIDNYSLAVTADNCRFGGESSGMPIVYNFAPQVVTPLWIGAQITITNSDLFCGPAGGTDTGVIVIGSGGYLPQNVCIQNCRGPSDSAWFNNKVAGTDLGAYIAALAVSDPNIRFTFTVAPNIGIGIVNLSTTVGNATDLDQCIRAGRYATWFALTLINSWANAGGPHNPAGCIKDDSGFVHLRGLLGGGTIPNPIATLPPGFRPEFTENVTAFSLTGGTPVATWIQITAAGSVILQAGGTTNVSLDGIVFKAAT